MSEPAARRPPPRHAPGPPTNPANAGFRPWRVLTVVAVIVVCGIGLNALSDQLAGVEGMAAFVMIVGGLWGGVGAFALLTGRTSHTTIGVPGEVSEANLERWRACVPSGCINCLGLVVAFVPVIVLDQPVEGAAGVVAGIGVVMFLAGTAGMIVTWLTLGPSVLIPATMRTRRQP